MVFVVFRESLPIQTAHELDNHLDAVEEISQGSVDSLTSRGRSRQYQAIQAAAGRLPNAT